MSPIRWASYPRPLARGLRWIGLVVASAFILVYGAWSIGDDIAYAFEAREHQRQVDARLRFERPRQIQVTVRQDVKQHQRSNEYSGRIYIEGLPHACGRAKRLILDPYIPDWCAWNLVDYNAVTRGFSKCAEEMAKKAAGKVCFRGAVAVRARGGDVSLVEAGRHASLPRLLIMLAFKNLLALLGMLTVAFVSSVVCFLIQLFVSGAIPPEGARRAPAGPSTGGVPV